MQIRKPKNNDKYCWTEHVYGKMIQYGISEQTVRRIVRNPERIEEGIAPNTIAVMQTRGKKQKYELWCMYQIVRKTKKHENTENTGNKSNQIKIITTWRYPGVSPKRAHIPIPEEIVEELGIVL